MAKEYSDSNINLHWIKDNKDNIVKLSLAIIALSVAYYLMIYIPHKSQEEIDFKKQQYQDQLDAQKKQQEDVQQQALESKNSLDTCLSSAETNYSKWWNSNCRERGLLPNGCSEEEINLSYTDYLVQNNIPKGTEAFSSYLKYSSQKENVCTCSLPSYLSDSLSSERQKAKDLCLKQYPQK